MLDEDDTLHGRGDDPTPVEAPLAIGREAPAEIPREVPSELGREPPADTRTRTRIQPARTRPRARGTPRDRKSVV